MNKLTIIIPFSVKSDNDVKVLYSTINQNYKNLEILVLKNPNVIINFTHPQVKFINSDREKSIPELLNEASSLTESPYIGFLHPNDLLLFDAVQVRYEKLIKNPNLVASIGLGLVSDNNFHLKNNLHHEYFLNENYEYPPNSLNSILNKEINPTFSSLIIKKEIFETLKVDDSLKATYEWDFFIRLYLNYSGKINLINKVMYISSAQETTIACEKAKFFVNCLKETMNIHSLYTSNNINEQYHKTFYTMLFLLVEYYKDNYKLKLYLLYNYIKLIGQNKEIAPNITFLAMLLNFIVSSKKLSLNKAA